MIYLVTVVKNIHDEVSGCEVAGVFSSNKNALEAKEKVEAYLTKQEETDFEVLVFSPDLNRLAYYDLNELITEHPDTVMGAYTSVWDGGISLTSKCIVNLETKEVTILESFDTDVDVLEEEYITLDGIEYDVVQKENKTSTRQFWYQ